MKKSLALAAILTVSLTACSSSETSDPGAPPSSSAGPGPSPTPAKTIEDLKDEHPENPVAILEDRLQAAEGLEITVEIADDSSPLSYATVQLEDKRCQSILGNDDGQALFMTEDGQTRASFSQGFLELLLPPREAKVALSRIGDSDVLFTTDPLESLCEIPSGVTGSLEEYSLEPEGNIGLQSNPGWAYGDEEEEVSLILTIEEGKPHFARVTSSSPEGPIVLDFVEIDETSPYFDPNDKAIEWERIIEGLSEPDFNSLGF